MKYVLCLILLMTTNFCTKNSSKKLIVGMELAYPPFEMKDKEGNPAGVSVDLAKELGKFLGKEIVIENIAWTGLIPSLQTGKIDLIISSITITEERKKQISFSDPYFHVKLAAIVNNNSSVRTQEDLNKSGVIIAVKQGATPFIFAHKYFTNAQINSFVSESAAMTEVLQGKADVMIYDQLTVYNNYKKYPDQTRILPLQIQEQDIDYLGIAVNKNNKELLDEINEFLVQFKQNNGFKIIGEKYFSTEKEDFKTYGLEFFF